MGLERNHFNPPDSAHYKPLGQDGRSLPFAFNPPPFDPKKEYPTQKDKDLANSGIKTLETRIADFMGEQKGAVSVPAAVGIGVGSGIIGGVGGFFLAKEVFAAGSKNEISINSFPNSFNNEGNKIIDERERFDNSATKGIVGPNNILVVPKEVFDKTPIADAQGKPVFDFPWDKNHPVEIRYKADAIGDSAIAEAKANGMPNAGDYKGYKPQLNSENTLPAGYEFPTIYPGHLFFMGSVYDEGASRKSSSNPYGLAVYSGPITMARIEFLAPNGILYFINYEIIDDSGGIEKQLPILPLTDAPLIGPGYDWEKGTFVEGLQKIFRTTQKGKLKMLIQGGQNGRLNGPETERVPGTFQFKTGTDAAGTQKILVSEAPLR